MAVPEENMHFQNMTEGDIEDVLIVENLSHRNPWSEGIFKDCLRVGYYCPMFKNDDEIIAYGVMSSVANEAHVFNICVAINFRGQGWGMKMMQHLLDVAKEKEAKSAFLEVQPSNEVAIELYNKLGFLEVGIRKDYYPAKNGREDALIFARDIF